MSDSPPCLGCGAPKDCDQPDQYAFSLTSDPTLPFVLNCPSGFNCNQALTLKLNCCGHILSASKAGNATNPQVSAILRALLIQCAQFNNQCAAVLPINNIVQNTIFSSVGQCTIFCPDGTPFTFTTPQTLYLGLTQQEADLFAHKDACRLAPIHLICIGSLPTTLTAGTPFTQNLLATGFLAVLPQQNLWNITGDIPTGMTFTDGFFSTGDGPALTGTPTTGGSFSFSVKVTNPNGDSQIKNFIISVVVHSTLVYFTFQEASSPWIDSSTSIPLPFGTFTSEPGFIGLAAGFPVAPGSTQTTTAYHVDSTVNTGITIWMWGFLSNLSSIQGLNARLSATTSAFQINIINFLGSLIRFQAIWSSSSTTVNVSSSFGAWHLYAMTWTRSTGNIVCYVDGVAAFTVPATTATCTTDDYLYELLCGVNGNGNGVDESGVWFGGAATPTQISQLWNAGAGVTWPTPKTIFP